MTRVEQDEGRGKICLDPSVLSEHLARAPHLSVVLTKGVYDLLHVGHVRSLLIASRLGDRLVVAVNSDAAVRARKGPSRPIIPQAERMQMLAALECVDWVTSYSTASPADLIGLLRPTVFAASHFNSMTADVRRVLEKETLFRVIPRPDAESTSTIVSRIIGAASRG